MSKLRLLWLLAIVAVVAVILRRRLRSHAKEDSIHHGNGDDLDLARELVRLGYPVDPETFYVSPEFKQRVEEFIEEYRPMLLSLARR